MNVVDALTRRCTGFGSISTYDIALYRLKCHQNDIYRGITPTATDDEYQPSDTLVYVCRFCTIPGYGQTLALANEDGKIALQNTDKEGNSNQQIDGKQAHTNAIFDIAWMPGEMKLVTTSGDHRARIWDVATSDIRQTGSYEGHTRSVKTAVFRPQDKAVFATGARDGAIMVWDIRANHTEHPRPDNCILDAHRTSKQRRSRTGASRTESITALAYQDEFSLLSCAAGDGVIKVWDMRKNYTVHRKEPMPKHTMNYSGTKSFSTLLVSPDAMSLYASCIDSIIYEYNIATYNPNPVAEFYGHRNQQTFFVKACLSPDGKYLASGSSDDYAYIWSTKRPGSPLIRLWGHTDEVTCIAWSNTSEPKIVTCSDDRCHRIWRVGLEHKMDNDDMEIRGRAEIVETTTLPGRATLEITPTVSRRWPSRQQRTPGSDTTPVSTPDGNRNDASVQNGESRNPSDVNSASKRTYVQMIGGGPWTDGKFKSVLSPIIENLEPKAKRGHFENRGARRLFSPINERDAVSLRRGYDSDEAGPSSSSSITERSRQTPFSPTLNLPNYVIDGTAPHLVQMSPQKSKENNGFDWLTKLRKERYELRVGKTEPEKPIVSRSPQITPARRASRSRSTEPRKVPKNPAVSLLNFFRVAGKDCDKDRFSEPEDSSKSSVAPTP